MTGSGELVDRVDRADEAVGVRPAPAAPRPRARRTERLSSADARLAKPLRHVSEVEAGAREDRREARRRARGSRPVRASSRWSQPRGGSLAHEREEAAVVLVARALRRVHRVGVAPAHDHHLRAARATAGRPTPRRCRGPTPTDGSARARRPVRVARVEQEAVPARGAARGARGRAARRDARSNRSRMQRGRQRRLGDARDAAAVGARPPAPPARPGEVARGGEPAAASAASGRRCAGSCPARSRAPASALELGPRARRVELRPAERRERRVPVPLVRVGGARRQRVPPGVVAAQDRAPRPP